MDNYNYLVDVYNQLPIHFTHGEGVWLYDQKNNRYLDALCGIAVTALGHNHPIITKTIQEQAAKIIHTSNLVQIPEQLELGERLVTASFGSCNGKAFFNNSGAEAVETAIKLARLYGHKRNINNPQIIVATGAFHGRTLATLTASSNPKFQEGFAPLLPGFIRVPYNDINAISQLAKANNNIIAILLEPIQGEGGIRVPNTDYLDNIRALCDQHQWLFLIDEVQTGMGRTGKLFAYQHSNIIPDAIILAKSLANGLPIGACIIHKNYCSLFTKGSHGSTFGGNPLCCKIAIATFDIIQNNKLWINAEKQGELLITYLRKALANHPHVIDIRGKGLMIGIELDKPCRGILALALQMGIIFNTTNNNVIRLLPPLIIEQPQIELILDIIPKLINQFYKKF